ncbi:hypothetical protein [Erythrobacter crassostreae]|uniref:hypothetical protein n=1 Tax=Erythrobacter crassostreae TaxID=2828328 RepID=UPI0021036EFD|nr:hypothetical protein [Erythrobacter crassostrea]
MTRKADPRTTRLPVPAGQIPDFTPVPRRCQRHDGWTEERQHAFIDALADTGSVAAACKTVDMSTEGAYYLRRQPHAESFRAAWAAALDLGVQRIEDVAMDRALNGVDEPLYSYGKLIGTRKRYNDRLLMFMLRNRAPERFAEGSPKALNAVGKMDEERLAKKLRKQLKKEIRAEMEAEAEANAPSPAQIRASIDAKVEGFRREAEVRRKAEWERLSKDTREAWERYEALKTRDMVRLAAEEAARRKMLEGPRVQVNAVPPVEQVAEPTPPKTVWSLKDDGWD